MFCQVQSVMERSKERLVLSFFSQFFIKLKLKQLSLLQQVQLFFCLHMRIKVIAYRYTVYLLNDTERMFFSVLVGLETESDKVTHNYTVPL